MKVIAVRLICAGYLDPQGLVGTSGVGEFYTGDATHVGLLRLYGKRGHRRVVLTKDGSKWWIQGGDKTGSKWHDNLTTGMIGPRDDRTMQQVVWKSIT